MLSELPDNPKNWFRANREKIIDILPNKEGIDTLLNLEPTHAVLEPTGIHYARLWADYLHHAGVKVLWVGHSQLCATRKAYRLPGKNDQADALALACYGLAHLGEPEYFLRFDLWSEAYEIRQYCLEIQHLERRTVPIKNRLRQQLSHEWPEIAEVKTKGALWKFLAGRDLPKAARTRYSHLAANSVGFGCSEFTRFQADQLCDIEDQIKAIEQKLVALTGKPEFHKYRAVLSQFGFGPRIEGLLLAHIYPFENFLGPNNREIIEFVSRDRRRTKRNRSLKSFKLFLGFGLVEDSSGKSEGWVPGGSQLCRNAIWQHIFTKIEPKGSRPKSAIGQELGRYCDSLKASRLNPKLVRSKVGVKLVEKLYQALLLTLCEG
ncbi:MULTISPECIES: transposase [unclassified Thermosynechococcus]|uniref:IS110 family transposase n=1 Tax=unclassified Thermosynechococcus TaxID=2622553 RepID=UPI002672040D|nr:transposase [Thermosynechococcus sp. JY1339]WNC54420.1 transposase [Thermosynechococcus sp. JY1331]